MLNVRKRSPRDSVRNSVTKRPRCPTGGSRTLRYEGPEGHEALVEVTYCDGSTTTHAGPKGQERMVTATLANGTSTHYGGEQGCEHVLQVERASKGRVDFYEGVHGQEVLRRTEWTDGRVRYWGGDRYQERKLRTTYPDGGMIVYSGGPREERMISYQCKDDTVLHHVGPKNAERGWLRVGQKVGGAQILDVAGRVTHSLTSDGKVLFHSKDGAHATYMPASKYQNLRGEVNNALNKLSDLNENKHCDEHTLVQLSGALRAIHDQMELCCIASSGTSHQSDVEIWSEVETEEEEEECVDENAMRAARLRQRVLADE